MWWRSSKKPAGTVKLTVVAFLDGKAINRQFTVDIKEGETLWKLFKRLDREGPLDRNYFKRIFSLSRPPTVLLNGDRLTDIPGDLKKITLKDADEISVLMPIAGG